ncbi:MAG: inorganic phosphate transporter [Thermoanaerobaculia bacterium]
MIALLVILTLTLAFANGANDVSKGIATLVGSGVTNYRRAVLWGSVCTVAGALTAAVASQALIATFSGKGLLRNPSSAPSFLLAVALGAIGWLIIATRTGMPVSTTHSITGALIGTALVSSGSGGLMWSGVAMKVGLPLLVSPVLSLLLLLAILPLLRPLTSRFDRYCVCIEERQMTAVTPDGVSFLQSMPAMEVAQVQECTTSVARVSAVDTLHWVSSGATSFFRGLNDTPKILAIGIAAAATIGISNAPAYVLVAVAMGAGSLFAGLRVTRTLAEKVTRISPANGFAANLVTSLLVGVASKYALPVSTTHVSSGAIIGVGVSRGGREVRWKTVTEMLLAWVVTLPVSALIASGIFALIR